MPSNVNRVIITGNLTRDPELRRTQSGMAIMSLGVAVNDRRKNSQTGEWEDYANFIDCTMFGTRAESLEPYLHKGSKVAIDGKLRWSQWERDGQKCSKVEVVVDDLEMLTPKQQDGGYARQQQGGGQQRGGYGQDRQRGGYAQQGYAQPAQRQADGPDGDYDVYDEDIPF